MSLAINKSVLKNLIEVHEAEADDQRDVLEEGDYILKNRHMSVPLGEDIFENEERLEKLLHCKSPEGRFFDVSTENEGLSGTLFYSHVQGTSKHKSLAGARDLATGKTLRLTPISKPESVITELNRLLSIWTRDYCGDRDGIVPGDLCKKIMGYRLKNLFASAQEYITTSREFDHVLSKMDDEFVAEGFVFEHTAMTYRTLVEKLDAFETEFERVEL